MRQGNARGMLFLHCGPDRANIDRQHVTPAMMAVHQTTGGNRYIPYASAMLPIRRGFVFRPVPQDLSGDYGGATVEAYWTPLAVA